MAPEQHNESIFKQILGGCSGIVNGLGTLRNKLGDAHGQGKRPVKPQARHAELAVNLAGTMSLFLISTYEAHKT
ncbi:TPA: abortive infection family protein [Vibrio parahaemolyticus]|nr:abortive infection family protein [Vibrio parahaemolyticus]